MMPPLQRARFSRRLWWCGGGLKFNINKLSNIEILRSIWKGVAERRGGKE
jgi:hypothetical protein